jgi:hypothetical protein
MKKIVAGRIFIILTAITLLASCTKTEEYRSLRSPEKFFVAMTVDGNKIEFYENKNGIVNGYGKGGIWIKSEGLYFERQLTTYARNGKNIFNICFMKWVSANPPSKEDIRSIFYPGSYSYGSSDVYNLMPGVEISYVEENGMEWNGLPRAIRPAVTLKLPHTIKTQTIHIPII